MKFYSTHNRKNTVDFCTAVLSGIANDGGLYMPQTIPQLPAEFTRNLKKRSFQEISLAIAEKFAGDEIAKTDLRNIIDEAINFPAPLIQLDDNLFVLELFHGPTLAFKDFGARFMAKTIGYFLSERDTEVNILVATSGDTGSAVAHGFYNLPGINVVVLFPKNKISVIQEKQITTLGGNIAALEIDGTFDDCQRLVKSAFADAELKGRKNLSSANSINIARLVPQTFYYFEAFKQLSQTDQAPIFSVPSGNLGNLTAGIIAKSMGLPVMQFIAATNSNDVFTCYLSTGKFQPRASVRTHSNAMDVGDPSNVKRIDDKFDYSIEAIKETLISKSFSDDETVCVIKEVKESFNYIIDPHGAVGYLAAKFFRQKLNITNPIIVLETAHPAKFRDVVENAIKAKVELPKRLAQCLTKESHFLSLSSNYKDFKDFLLFW